MSIYELVKAGETVTVQSPFSGKVFQVQPETWEGIVLGYSLVERGAAVPGYHRKMFQGREAFGQLVDGLIVVSHEKTA